MRLNLQAKNQLNIILKNIKILVKVVIVTKRKRNTNHMKNFQVNSKISNLLCLKERSTTEKKEAWLSGMKKYFHIYNYFDELKTKMSIYKLTRKAYILLQDIKKVKGIK